MKSYNVLMAACFIAAVSTIAYIAGDRSRTRTRSGELVFLDAQAAALGQQFINHGTFPGEIAPEFRKQFEQSRIEALWGPPTSFHPEGAPAHVETRIFPKLERPFFLGSYSIGRGKDVVTYLDYKICDARNGGLMGGLMVKKPMYMVVVRHDDPANGESSYSIEGVLTNSPYY